MILLQLMAGAPGYLYIQMTNHPQEPLPVNDSIVLAGAEALQMEETVSVATTMDSKANEILSAAKVPDIDLLLGIGRRLFHGVVSNDMILAEISDLILAVHLAEMHLKTDMIGLARLVRTHHRIAILARRREKNLEHHIPLLEMIPLEMIVVGALLPVPNHHHQERAQKEMNISRGYLEGELRARVLSAYQRALLLMIPLLMTVDGELLHFKRLPPSQRALLELSDLILLIEEMHLGRDIIRKNPLLVLKALSRKLLPM